MLLLLLDLLETHLLRKNFALRVLGLPFMLTLLIVLGNERSWLCVTLVRWDVLGL